MQLIDRDRQGAVQKDTASLGETGLKQGIVELLKSIKLDRIQSKYLRIDPLTKRKAYDPRVYKQIEEDIAKHGFRDEHPLVVRPDPKRRGHWLSFV